MRKLFLILSRTGDTSIIHPDLVKIEDLRTRLVEGNDAEDALRSWCEEKGYKWWNMIKEQHSFSVYEVNLVGPLLNVVGTPQEVFQATHPGEYVYR